MNQADILKNILNWYKTSFYSTSDVVDMYQEQAENLFQTFTKNTNLPEESRRTIEEWFSFMRQSQIDFKESMETGLKQLEIYLASFAPDE